jgi:phosphoglycerate dehydrogenase-like enzyme/glyoxylase-like metal-dependent hydrolase (beta-lactamase superfamily II)
MSLLCRAALVVAAFLLPGAHALAGDLPAMKFREVREIAPGVFFRYSRISPTDWSVFEGCNNSWVVFQDYVVVIDANFPKEAGDVIEAIKKTTDKPIRYVFDTHHHGDHAYGNVVFGKGGAQIVAQANCARLLRVDGPKQFAEAGRGPLARKDVAASTLKTPDIIFDDKLVIDDGTQRVEFLFMGHAHTAGDAVAYLPKHKILCTGDACVNGAYNFMGHADSASWIRALERMQQLDVQMVCPGHGPLAGKDLLERQKRYFGELRQQVQKGVDAAQTVDEVVKSIDMPWYKEWTGVKPSGDNIKFVYAELTGGVAPWDFSEEFGILEGPSATKSSPGWKKPQRIVISSGLMPGRIDELKRVAPDIEFIPAKSVEAAVGLVEDADGIIGLWSPEIAAKAKHVTWLQTDDEVSPAVQGNVTVTNSLGAYGPPMADQALALLLPLLRKGGGEAHGKTVVIVGQSGSANPVARRANAFGMRVRLVDGKLSEKPVFAFSLDKPAKLGELLPRADAVVVCCPLSDTTKGLIGKKEFAAMKTSASVVDVGRPGVVDHFALFDAVRAKRLAGASIDVPMPPPTWQPQLQGVENFTMSVQGTNSPEARERRWRLLRENVRRFAVGEPLLCVVEK